MKFHEILLQFRKAQGLSQEALAEKVGVSRQAVSKWETGEALPDLQKAVLLSEALGVSLDSLCGREPLSAAADAPAGRKKRAMPVVLAAAFLCAGLLLGGVIFGNRQEAPPQNDAEVSSPESGAETPQPAPMPDVVTVSDVSFYAWGTTKGSMTYQFVPSVAGSGYTYRISFTDSTGKTQGFDAPYSDGMCAGTVVLSPYGEYSVAATISNGVEERAAALASGMTVYGNRVNWTPSAP